jgi:broad specificity phosphatase PhoE
MEKTVFLFRHAEPQPKDPKCCKGKHLDCELTLAGEDRTRLNVESVLARVGADVHSTMVVTTPLTRGRRFGEIWVERTGLRDSHVVDEALIDIDVGEWEDKPWTEIKGKYPDLVHLLENDGRKLVLPGGEAVEDFEARLLEHWQRFTKLRCRNLILVAHLAVVVPIVAHVDHNPVLRFKDQLEGGAHEIIIDAAGRARVGLRNVFLDQANSDAA